MFWREIANDRALRIYGALLALAEIINLGWLRHAHVEPILAGGEALCWPMWPSCGEWRGFSVLGVRLVLAGVFALAAAAIFCFWRGHTRAAMALLAVSESAKLAIAFQDFRFRQNQHYMLFFTVLAFLLLPQKRRALRYLVVLFYFWAGWLKVNREWMTGAAMYSVPSWVGHGLLVAACLYVVFLELVVVWGLLSQRRSFFIAAAAQVFAFELFSFAIVGFFYPLLMLLLLSIFVLAREPNEAPFRFWREPVAVQGFLALFCLLQLVPRFFPGDSAMTGEGRLFALHMFDAKIACDSSAVVFRAGAKQRFDLRTGLPVRTACDPAVLVARGRTLCSRFGDARVDLHLTSRRSSEAASQPVVDIEDFADTCPSIAGGDTILGFR